MYEHIYTYAHSYAYMTKHRRISRKYLARELFCIHFESIFKEGKSEAFYLFYNSVIYIYP